MRKSLLLLSLCASFGAHAAPQIAKVEFTPTLAPQTDAERTSYYTRSSAIVTYANGRKQAFPLAYNVLYRAGDRIGDAQAGLILDGRGKPVMRSAADPFGEVAQGPFVSSAPDGNSLLGMRAGTDTAYLMTHFEYSTEAPNVDAGKLPVQLYGQLPAAIYEATVVQEKKSGRLRVVGLNNVDTSGVDGIWTPCAASCTPWGTHLGGEEYEPNAKEFETAPFQAMNLYTGTLDRRSDEGGSNPYAYGYKFELSVSAAGEPKLVKHYSMGRLANELGDVMPDKRTVYMGDDGRDTAMFMYVADRAGQLSSGTLYAAMWMPVTPSTDASAILRWIPLGNASDEEIRKLIQSGIKFSDIFQVATQGEVMENPGAFGDFKPVYVYPGTGKESAHLEYLKLNAGMEKAAAFLESRRYAAMLGATTEFTKMEGVTHNERDKKLYLALSYIEKGMVDKYNDNRPHDDINLTANPTDLACGAVLESELRGGELDHNGRKIQSDWVAASMRVMISGAAKPLGQKHGEMDKCDTDRIAGPDNLKYSESMRTLFIGEDSGNHLNNFVWAYNIDAVQTNPVRIFSAPIGGESTGLQVIENWNGHAYLMSNIQHPAATEDLSKYPPEIAEVLSKKTDKRGVVGYISGLPYTGK
jgi:secreted PhoX family phosphatase